ncbi:MAG: hypothetical protein U0Y68_17430 [Blastocatellia bacterium]
MPNLANVAKLSANQVLNFEVANKEVRFVFALRFGGELQHLAR